MIDFRSDTVTRPSPQMREAMATAEVGDDVWGDDPTVQQLEATAAEMLDKQAAMFAPSGTQSNLCALMAHCGRGDEYITGNRAHTYWYEAGGAAVLGSVQPQTVGMLDDGSLDLDEVAEVIKPDDHHFARSRLLSLENTHDGKVVPLARQEAAAALARKHGMALHLDGARVWNAAVSLGATPAEVAEPFDTVSVCLSKGLGAPVGSILVGSADAVSEARKWRKMLGGAMRQSGVIAAAGLYALEHNIQRLADDHAKAERLAEGLNQIEGVVVERPQTNMVFARFPEGIDANGAFSTGLADHGIQFPTIGPVVRLVTHLDLSDEDVETTITTVTKLVEPGS